jgi:hypothetical protein
VVNLGPADGRLTYGPPGSEEEDEPDYGWDFSGLGNPSAMRDFMTACDYCLSDCSDGSRGSRRRQPPWYARGRRSPLGLRLALTSFGS